MDITNENIQASDIIKFVTERIEFVKNINMTVPDNIENVLLTDTIKTPIIQELEALKSILVFRIDKKIIVDIFMMVKSITNQIDILAAISVLQQKNKHYKLEPLIKTFISLVKNELDILNEINLKCQEKVEEKLNNYFEKFNEIAAKELEIMMKLMIYNMDGEEKESGQL